MKRVHLTLDRRQVAGTWVLDGFCGLVVSMLASGT